MKIYVVTKGDYEEEEILGIYSTPEKANDVAKVYGGNPIREYDLDGGYDRIESGIFPYELIMKKDGEVDGITIKDFDEEFEGNSLEVWTHVPTVLGKEDLLTIKIWAKSEENAIEIADKKRKDLIKEDKWKDDYKEKW